ncbi:MAG: hypothetical protein LUC39_09335, partial [Clostridiales bacterium]|nr:hypothetical protein [Clostridiales bacterium]
ELLNFLHLPIDFLFADSISFFWLVDHILPGYADHRFPLAFGAEQREVYLNFQPYLAVITATMPKTTAKPMRKYRAILLKSKKPLPVTVTAPTIATTVKTATIILTILQTVFFVAIHPYYRDRISQSIILLSAR